MCEGFERSVSPILNPLPRVERVSVCRTSEQIADGRDRARASPERSTFGCQNPGVKEQMILVTGRTCLMGLSTARIFLDAGEEVLTTRFRLSQLPADRARVRRAHADYRGTLVAHRRRPSLHLQSQLREGVDAGVHRIAKCAKPSCPWGMGA